MRKQDGGALRTLGLSVALRARGVIETLFYISKVRKAGYYELYKQNFVVSRQTFSGILKTLEEGNNRQKREQRLQQTQQINY